MNGFMMCVLLAATGQVGDAAERDFGWQINPNDGKLEYIVQLSPQKANYMASASKEQESEVPSAVAARLSRVVVRIGTEPLISTPMEEVLKLPPVSLDTVADIEAIAGRGRFAQLENAAPGEVRNVSGDGAPPPLSSSPSALPNAPGTSLAEQASQLGSNLGQTIQSDLSDALSTRGAEALRKAENLLAQNLTPNAPGSSLLNDSRGISTGPGKFSNTATQPAAPPAGSTSTPLPGSPSSTVGPPAPAGNYATSPAHNHAPGDGFHHDGTAAAPPINSSIGSSPLAGAPSSGLGNSPYPGSNSSLPGANTNTGQPYNNPTGGYAGGTTPGYNSAPSYNNTAPSYNNTAPGYNGGSSYGMTPLNGANTGTGNLGSGNFGGGNFGGMPRGGANQTPYNQYATVGSGAGQYPYGPAAPAYNTGSNPPSPGYGGQPSSVYASDPLSLPSGNYQPTRIADRSSTNFPTTSSGSTPTSSSSSNARGSSSNTGKGHATEVDRDAEVAESYPNSRSGMENVLPVMFVLSLVVNFYLGMLIRKLLTRYRSLLSSVRGQAV